MRILDINNWPRLSKSVTVLFPFNTTRRKVLKYAYISTRNIITSAADAIGIKKTKQSVRGNKKKVKRSYKVKTNELIEVFNFKFDQKIRKKKLKFTTTNKIIKSNEDLIIDNNVNLIVLNKSSVKSCQDGTKEKKN